MTFKIIDINTGLYFQSLKVESFEPISIRFTEYEGFATVFNDRENAVAIRDCIQVLDQESEMEIV